MLSLIGALELEFLLSLAATIVGAHYLIECSSRIARRLHISEFIIGFTLLAVGTSLPETAANISAALANHGEIVVNSVFGSNIVNVAIGVGLGIIISQEAIKSVSPAIFSLIATILAGLLLWDQVISLWDALILLAFLLAVSTIFIGFSKIIFF